MGDYVLVFFGAMIGYAGDDMNKFLWMIRIAAAEFPDEVVERNFLSQSGAYAWSAGHITKTMKDSLMYKLSYYRFGKVSTRPGMTGYDNVRRYEIGHKDI